MAYSNKAELLEIIDGLNLSSGDFWKLAVGGYFEWLRDIKTSEGNNFPKLVEEILTEMELNAIKNSQVYNNQAMKWGEERLAKLENKKRRAKQICIVIAVLSVGVFFSDFILGMMSLLVVISFIFLIRETNASIESERENIAFGKQVDARLNEEIQQLNVKN